MRDERFAASEILFALEREMHREVASRKSLARRNDVRACCTEGIDRVTRWKGSARTIVRCFRD